MDELIKTVEKYKSLIIVGLAALMFVFFALCSAVDVMGKAQANGFKVLFDGSGLGFSRFLSLIIILLPILIIVGNYVNLNLSGKLKENFNAICFGAGFIVCLLMAIILPSPISLAWGGWLYILLAALGVAVSCIDQVKASIKK